MTDFENEQYENLHRLKEDAVALLKNILATMKHDEREGDRYVYEAMPAIKEFLKRAKK